MIEDVQPADVCLGVAQAPRLPAGGAAAPAARFQAFDNTAPYSVSARRLPHWRQDGATYFVTFRLADSIPAAIFREWQHERAAFLEKHGSELTAERRTEMNEFFREKLEEHLDRNLGSCVLREDAAAAVVEETLRKFDGERYQLGSFVIMPNHVHAIVAPLAGHELSAILHSWKSSAAHAINKAFQRTGSVWQDESFDHIIRDEAQLAKYERYIEMNPAKAGLTTGFRVGSGTAVAPEGAAEAAAPHAGRRGARW